jgi:hypothetical protein
MITLILAIALVGFLVWALTTYVPMPQPFKVAIIAIAVIVLILYVIRALGIADLPLR